MIGRSHCERADERPGAARREADGAARPRARQDGATCSCRTARVCANQGRLAEAIEWCEKAIAADKLNPAHHYLLATIQQEQGQSEAAAQSLMRALYLDPISCSPIRLAQPASVAGPAARGQRHFAMPSRLLRCAPADEILPESDGLTAGRLVEIIASVRSSLPRAGDKPN